MKSYWNSTITKEDVNWNKKTHMNNEQCCSVDGGRGICPLFWTHPGGFDSSRVPTPGNLPSKAKIMLMPEGQPRAGEGLGAAGIDWCIRKTLLFSWSDKRQDLAWNRQQTEWNIAHKWSPSYLQKPAYGSMPFNRTRWNQLKLDLYPIFLSRELLSKVQ